MYVDCPYRGGRRGERDTASRTNISLGTDGSVSLALGFHAVTVEISFLDFPWEKIRVEYGVAAAPINGQSYNDRC